MGVTPLRLVFLGTPDFAVPTLEKLLEAGHRVLEVITQPDRPKGRKQEMTPSPVKACALRHGLPVYQPERIRRPEAVGHLKALAPDAMVVVGYGQIIPQSVIDIAPLGILNVHASLLPELRGAAPMQWAVARGFRRTGVTIMQIDAGLDTGAVLSQWETPVGSDETAPEVAVRLSQEGANLLVQTLEGLRAGTVTAVPQDDARATLAPILKKEDGRIDWTAPALEIHNRIRGLQPWPGAYTVFRGLSLHVWRSRLADGSWDAKPGTILERRGLFAVGGDGAALELLEVQLEGKKRMPAQAFAAGQRPLPQERLGA
jgi:methionyl-tRNA formyltransferase